MDLAGTERQLKKVGRARKAQLGKGRERDDRLRELLVQLEALQRPITALLKATPRTGAALRHVEERALSKEIQAERKRVNAMLQRSPGGGKSSRAEPYRPVQYQGFIWYVRGKLNEHRAALDNEEPGTPEHRQAAAEAMRTASNLRKQINIAQHKVAYWSAAHTRDGGWSTRNGLSDKNLRLLEDGADLTKEVGKLHRLAQRAVKRKTKFQPPTRPRKRWTKETAARACTDWMLRYGRVPRTADFRADPELPSYETMRKISGGLPTEKMAAWLAEQTS